MHSTFKFGLVVLTLSVSIFAQAKTTYILKKGDTLASVARSYYGEPVFGPKGSINKIYKLNSWAKAVSTSLEPGQKLVLEDKSQSLESEETASAATVVPAPIAPPTAEPVAPGTDSKSAILPLAGEEEKLKTEEMQHQAAHSPLTHENPANALLHEPHKEHEQHHNYFSVIPSYSQITQTATDAASGVAYSLSSTVSVGIELGWDHWWNESFSTLLTYSISQVKSTSTSALTGEAVLGPTTINRLEVAFLNHVLPRFRFGMGASYGDHLFLENFSDTPANPKIYKATFWNPFLAGELTMHESERYECLLNLKLSELPAQVGNGHDLNSAKEFYMQISLLQKFETWAMTYGLSFSGENQTRTDASEVRTETALAIGVLF